MNTYVLVKQCLLLALISAVVLFTGSTPACAANQPIVLHTEAQDTAPKWILDEGGGSAQSGSAQSGSAQIGGLCADILRAIERESKGLQFHWNHEFVPLKRIFKHLASGKIDLVVGYAHNPPRAEQFVYSQTPLYMVNHVLAVRKDDPLRITSFEGLAALGEQGKVLTVFGGATAAYLKQQPGVIVDDYGKTPEIVLQRLLKGRGRVFYYYDYSMIYTIARNTLQDRVTILPHSFRTYPHYIIYSRHLSQEVINEIERIVGDLADRGEFERIYQKYIQF